MTAAHQYAAQNYEHFKNNWLDLLRIPSVSTDPAFAAEVRHAAEWLVGKMKAIGLEAEAISMTEGRHPVVFGSWDGAGPDAKTVLIYSHYDVQPAVLEDGWNNDPFEPVEQDDFIYARGATDSKIHVISQLSAIESLLKSSTCPVNLRLLFEGEEESGGETIGAFIAHHPDRVKADVAVISDGGIVAPDQPSLCYGLRGIITFEIHLEGPKRDLHSGHWGGSVHNPAQALTEIIAQLHDAEGRVTVPGFYDEVRPLDDAEREVMKSNLPWLQSEYQDVAAAPAPWGESDYTLHEKVGARPTLEVNGISGGYTGAGFKTVLPSRALAKISCRLVPDQDPHRIIQCVTDYIRQITPRTMHIRLENIDYGRPGLLLDRNTLAMRAAAEGYAYAWGKEPIYERAGGSVPVAYDLKDVCDNVVIMGFSYRGGGAHGPNEHARLSMFRQGIDAAIAFIYAFAKQ